MKKFNTFLVATAVLMACAGCSIAATAITITPSDNTVERTFNNIKGFSGISVSQGIDVKYTQTSSTSIKAEVPENLSQYLIIVKEGDNLSIKFKDKLSIHRGPNTTVYVSAPGISTFSVSSGAEIDAADVSAAGKTIVMSASSGGEIEIARASCEKIRATASSAGEITVKNLSAADVTASSSSGADIEFGGTATSASFTASSGADISAKNLLVQEASASASSGADISVNARQLSSSTSSGGSVKNKN